MKRIAFGVAALMCMLVTGTVYAAEVSELHVNADGSFSAKNVTVVQKSGNTLFTRAKWDLMYVRVTILATKETPVTRKYGESASVDDVAEGDVLNVEGKLTSGEGALMVKPTKVQDISIEKAGKRLTGKIISIDAGAKSFKLKNPQGVTTVFYLSTTTIQKGVRTIGFDVLSEGDKILSVNGEYDYTTQSLKAEAIVVYQDPALFVARNFECELISIEDQSLNVTCEGRPRRIENAAAVKVLNSAKNPVTLSRFSAGDKLRIFGAIRQTDLKIIDPEIVRNMSF